MRAFAELRYPYALPEAANPTIPGFTLPHLGTILTTSYARI